MFHYNPRLKTKARSLRANPTDAELRLWYRLRRKQILGVQFYRQKTIGNYIVDFYAPAVKLVVEVDGAHHFTLSQAEYDKRRSEYLEQRGLRVLRRQASFAANRICSTGDFSGHEKSLLTSLYKREE